MKADKHARKMNRAARRKAAAVSARTAKLMAHTALDYTPDGKRIDAVEAPAAIAALVRAFTALLQNGCEPLAIRLKPETACQFPRGTADVPEGSIPYMAVGLDPDGRCTYVVRYVSVRNTPLGVPPNFADIVGREQALEYLALHLQERGFRGALG